MTDGWTILLIAIAGGVGAVVRYLVHARPGARPRLAWSGPVPRPAKPGIWDSPHTRLFAVNVAASLIAGFVSAFLAGPWGVILVTGFCGGLSTWSTLMNDARLLLDDGRLGRGLGILALALACSIAAVLAGWQLAGLLAGLLAS